MTARQGTSLRGGDGVLDHLVGPGLHSGHVAAGSIVLITEMVRLLGHVVAMSSATAAAALAIAAVYVLATAPRGTCPSDAPECGEPYTATGIATGPGRA